MERGLNESDYLYTPLVGYPRIKSRPLSIKKDQVMVAWGEAKRRLNRRDRRNPNTDELFRELFVEVKAFMKLADTCVMSGRNCQVHGTNRRKVCISNIEDKADGLIRRIRETAA